MRHPANPIACPSPLPCKQVRWSCILEVVGVQERPGDVDAPPAKYAGRVLSEWPGLRDDRGNVNAPPALNDRKNRHPFRDGILKLIALSNLRYKKLTVQES